MDLPFPLSGDLIAALVFPGVLGIFGFLVVAIWLERKLVARVQWRYGPLYVSKPLGGLLQPVADLLKLVFSELVLPRHTNRLLFAATPVLLSSATTATSVAAGNADPLCRKNVSANAVDGGAAS
jgi:NADH-quinone oxidoreductase subunit H